MMPLATQPVMTQHEGSRDRSVGTRCCESALRGCLAQGHRMIWSRGLEDGAGIVLDHALQSLSRHKNGQDFVLA